MVKLPINPQNGEKYDAVLTEGSLENNLRALTSQGYHPARASEFVLSRVSLGKGSDFYNNGSVVSECFVHVPKQGFYVARNSPMFSDEASARKATRLSKSGSEYKLTAPELTAVLSDSLPIDDSFKVKTNDLSSHPFFSYLFGGLAAPYGQFLSNNGVKELSVDLSYISNPGIYVRPLYIGSLREKSMIDSSLLLHDCECSLAGFKVLPPPQITTTPAP